MTQVRKEGQMCVSRGGGVGGNKGDCLSGLKKSVLGSLWVFKGGLSGVFIACGTYVIK